MFNVKKEHTETRCFVHIFLANSKKIIILTRESADYLQYKMFGCVLPCIRRGAYASSYTFHSPHSSSLTLLFIVPHCLHFFAEVSFPTSPLLYICLALCRCGEIESSCFFFVSLLFLLTFFLHVHHTLILIDSIMKEAKGRVLL